MQHAIKRVALPTYYAHDDPSSNEMLLLLFQSYTLTGLNTYTQYLVSLKAYNPAGAGPETIVVVMTDEGGMYELYIFLATEELFKDLDHYVICRSLS